MRLRGRERVSTAVSGWLPAGAPHVFNPADLSPALWLDASDTSTITESSGAVSQWNDKSGNGRNVTQATGVRQPSTGTATINSLNVLAFDGGDILQRATFTMTTRTVFVVAEATGAPTSQGALWRHNASTGNGINILRHNGTGQNSILYFYRLTSALATSLSGLTAPHQITGRFTDSATIEARLNGSQVASEVVGAAALASDRVMHVGGDSLNFGSAPTEGFVGRIAEIICYTATLSDTNMGLVESYLETKWNL
jgi:hypothetical protein